MIGFDFSSLIRVLPFLFSIAIEILSRRATQYWSNSIERAVRDAAGVKADTGWITDAMSYYLAAQAFWIGLAMTFITVVVLVLQTDTNVLLAGPPIPIAVAWYYLVRPKDYALDATTGGLGFRIPGLLTILINFIYIVIYY